MASAETERQAKEKNALQIAQQQAALEAVDMGFGSGSSFMLLQRAAGLLATSSLLPKEFQGNVANCAIAINMAQRLKCDPLMVIQNLYIVYGRPGWSSQFLIATLNQSGRFEPLKFEFFGERGTDGYGCRAWTIERATGQKLVGSDITIRLARAEGWYDRKSNKGECASKWPTMTQQMLIYRAAAWFVRAYAPEIAMGFRTADELEDIGPQAQEKNITSQSEVIEKTPQKPASSLDAIVDKAKGPDPIASAPADPPRDEVKPEPQRSATAASKPIPGGNPDYAEGCDPDPAYEGTLFPGREPGMEG